MSQRGRLAPHSERVRSIYRPNVVTFGLILVNLLVFTAMGFPTQPVPNHLLLAWGASWGPLSLDGQWWRIFISMFVHKGLPHLLVNVGALWIFGRIGEQLFARSAVLSIYLLSGVAGELMGLATAPEAISCGASGAIFGIVGSVIAPVLLRRTPRTALHLKTRIWPLLLFAGYNLYSGFADHSANNAAHLGGILFGLMIGLAISAPAKATGDRIPLHTRVVILASVILASAAIFIGASNGYVSSLRLAADALADGRFDDAAANAKAVLSRHPNDVLANTMMAELYSRTGEYSLAESSLKHALSADPDNIGARTMLGRVYLETGRAREAQDLAFTVIQQDPGDLEAHRLLAAALDANGAHLQAGEYYLHMHDYDRAITALLKATQEKPDDARSRHDLAIAYRAKGMSDKADAIEKEEK